MFRNFHNYGHSIPINLDCPPIHLGSPLGWVKFEIAQHPNYNFQALVQKVNKFHHIFYQSKLHNHDVKLEKNLL